MWKTTFVSVNCQNLTYYLRSRLHTCRLLAFKLKMIIINAKRLQKITSMLLLSSKCFISNRDSNSVLPFLTVKNN